MRNCPILIIEIILNSNHRASISWLKLHLSPYPQLPQRLVLVAGLYLALVVGVGAVVAEPALPIDELLANSICHQLVVVIQVVGISC